MLTNAFHNLRAATVLVFFAPALLAADDSLFEVQDIGLDLNVTHPVLVADILPTAGQELIVAGIDKQQQTTIAILASSDDNALYQVVDQFTVSNDIFAFDVGDTESSAQQSLYFLGREQIWQYQLTDENNISRFLPLQTVNSVYVAEYADYLLQQDFARDINHDGLDDFILPHFEHTNLWLSSCCQQRHLQQLPVRPHLKVNNNGVSFSFSKLYFTDTNQDQKQDIVWVNAGQLEIFHQRLHGQFEESAQLLAINPNIHGINWWDKLDADGQTLDQSQLRHKVVEQIQDINNDGIPDMVVRFTKSTGVLDKINDYELYLGQLKEGQWQLLATPNSVLQSDETLSGLQIVDLQDDGRFELLVSRLDLGLTQIISALLAGSIDQEMLLYSLDEQGQIQQDPMTSQDVEITFSLSRGRSGEPMVKILEINGDGHKDIVLSSGSDNIKIFYATPQDKRPFARRSQSFKIALPANAKDIAATDINGDGKTDLILHYGRLDTPSLLNHIKILRKR